MIIFCLLIAASSSLNLTCSGRTKYNTTTVESNFTYTPQFWINFGIILRNDEPLIQDVIVILKS
jgi:hypothetical protein